MNTRAMSNGDIEVESHSTITHETFINDASRAWNKAPNSIKSSKPVYSAKKNIKIFVKSLPI